MNIFKVISKWFKDRKKKKEIQKKLEELRKRDPFIYKH
jgi:hypothetical protein